MEYVLVLEPFTEERGGYTFNGVDPIMYTTGQFLSEDVDMNTVCMVGSYAQCLKRACEINAQRGRFKVLQDQLALMN